VDTLLAPLKDLAEAIEAEGVRAEVSSSMDERRWHLVLWPLHRPAFKSFVLTFHVYGGRVLVPTGSAGETVDFADPESFTAWLLDFARSASFRSSLAELKSFATESVDARVERENGMAKIVNVPPELQAQLDALGPSQELAVTVELAPHEKVPERPESLVRLRSAGLDFELCDVQAIGRSLHFVAKRVSLG
jgi:hypothetical protein